MNSICDGKHIHKDCNINNFQEFNKMSPKEVYRIQGQLIALERLKRKIEES